MRWYDITANLVLPDSEDVDETCGYRFELPLDDNRQLVEKDWKQSERPYKVTRFWKDEPTLTGELILHMRNSWLIKYPRPVKPDATVQLGEEIMVVGEPLCIRDHASAAHNFRITSLHETHWFPTATELGHE